MRSFLAGLGAGAVFGVLFAPRNGGETREQLLSKSRVLRNYVSQRTGALRRGVQKQFSRLQTQAAGLTENTGTQLKTAAQSAASKVGLGALAKLNLATREELMSINGIGPVLADRIVTVRPFTSTQQVLEQGLLPKPTFNELIRVFEAA